jgi:hypothetical protein
MHSPAFDAVISTYSSGQHRGVRANSVHGRVLVLMGCVICLLGLLLSQRVSNCNIPHDVTDGQTSFSPQAM